MTLIDSILDSGRMLVGEGRYQLCHKIGSGAFGNVYLARYIANGKLVAVKLEHSKRIHRQRLKSEFEIYSELWLNKEADSPVGVPKIYYAGEEGDCYVLIMELLGPTIEQLFQFCQRRFSLKTVLSIGIQAISRLEFLHSKGYVYRDIKADNFSMGLGERNNILYLFDFGLAERYLHHDNSHISCRDGRPLIGTARYSSNNAHRGIEQSRRDDIESLGYMLIYFLRGSLPWQGLGGAGVNSEQRVERIKEKKLSTSIEQLCDGFPAAALMAWYLGYCRSLSFYDKPNYGYLRCCFKTAAMALNMYSIDQFEWNDIALIKSSTELRQLLRL